MKNQIRKRIRIISKTREPFIFKGSRVFSHPRDVNVMLKRKRLIFG